MEDCKCSSAPSICNALLGYMVASVQCSTVHNVRRVVLGYFTPAEIHDAKTVLLEHTPAEILKSLAEQAKNRRGSSAKSREEFEVDDILDVMDTLDKSNATPVIHVPALQLLRLPKIKPEDMLSVQMVERLKNLEDQVSGLSESFDLATIDSCSMKTRISGLETKVDAMRFPDPASLHAAPSVPPSTSSGTSLVSPNSGSNTMPKEHDEASTSQSTDVNEWTDVVKRRKTPPKQPMGKPAARAMVRLATAKLPVVTGKRNGPSGVRGLQGARYTPSEQRGLASRILQDCDQ